MRVEGKIPVELPIPYLSKNLVGRLYLNLGKKHYIIDVWPYEQDGVLVWAAYRWNGYCWPKIPDMTRSQEKNYPKTVAQRAYEFHKNCVKQKE